MPQQRVDLRMITDILRLKYRGGLSHERIACSLSISKGAVAKYLSLEGAAGLGWASTIDPYEASLERQLMGGRCGSQPGGRARLRQRASRSYRTKVLRAEVRLCSGGRGGPLAHPVSHTDASVPMSSSAWLRDVIVSPTFFVMGVAYATFSPSSVIASVTAEIGNDSRIDASMRPLGVYYFSAGATEQLSMFTSTGSPTLNGALAGSGATR